MQEGLLDKHGRFKTSNPVISIDCRVATPVLNKQMNSFDSLIEQFQKITFAANRHFGKVIVLTLLSGFVCITSQVYYVINVIRKFTLYQRPELVISLSVSLVLLHVIEFSILFTLGSKVKDEVLQLRS